MTLQKTKENRMKNFIIIMGLAGLASVGQASENTEPASVLCTIQQTTTNASGVSATLKEEHKVNLVPGEEAIANFGDYKVGLVVCNVDPVSEVDLFVQKD